MLFKLSLCFVAISKNVTKRHPHTIFIDFNHEKVGNVFEEQVTEEQIIGRSLLKTFTAAASYARQEFGVSTTLLHSYQ